eukprot:gb/GECG01008450.1/.p1 GENE.gb/GECG01008450.1/~~gb/GECG01008450.1/.p1  ORF type:complete len:195 (+),score=12.48 gb/GECG01008450.1/:1-585(+)
MPRVDYHKIGGGLKDGIFEAAAAGDKDGLHGLLLKLMQDEEQPDRVLVNVNKLYHQAKGSYCGRVPLLAHAAYHGQVEVVHYLIYEDGADPNVKDPTEGNTPLHFAALGGMPETIKKLYDCGAELREPNNVSVVEKRSIVRYSRLLAMRSSRSVLGPYIPRPALMCMKRLGIVSASRYLRPRKGGVPLKHSFNI